MTSVYVYISVLSAHQSRTSTCTICANKHMAITGTMGHVRQRCDAFLRIIVIKEMNPTIFFFNVRDLITRAVILCAVRMRNAILRNDLMVALISFIRISDFIL